MEFPWWYPRFGQPSLKCYLSLSCNYFIPCRGRFSGPQLYPSVHLVLRKCMLQPQWNGARTQTWLRSEASIGQGIPVNEQGGIEQFAVWPNGFRMIWDDLGCFTDWTWWKLALRDELVLEAFHSPCGPGFSDFVEGSGVPWWACLFLKDDVHTDGKPEVWPPEDVKSPEQRDLKASKFAKSLSIRWRFPRMGPPPDHQS